MLAFITSLRHPQNATDYERVEELLQMTLRSINNQTSDEYVVIVVGNRKPSFALPERVHFVHVKFRAPAPPKTQASRQPFIRDKGTKIGVGLIKAREFNPDYVMIIDADDFVHRDLTEFTVKNPGTDGWVVTEGWLYSSARAALAEQPEFNRICGTSFVIPFEAYGVPTDLDVTATRGKVKTAYGERLSRIIGAHKYALEWYEEAGMSVQPLPFRGAVYHVDTGENHSRDRFELPTGFRRADKSFTRDFGIAPRGGRMGTFWSYYCSTGWLKITRPFDPLRAQVRRVYRGVRRRLRRR